jgi:hypothetical protein
MVKTADTCETPAERLVGGTIRLTWVFYGLGALYIVGPVLAWSLAAMVLMGLYLGPALQAKWHAKPIPLGVWIWIVGMLIMLVALLIGHSNYSLGIAKTIKSTIGWAKGWALMALFPLAGACLNIRPQIIYRACNQLGLQTMLILPFLLAAPYIGLPETLFVSPLKAVGGPGPEFFSVFLYITDPGTGGFRWQFFAPWAPAAGMMGVLIMLCGIEDNDKRWRIAGFIAGLTMILLSKSRMSLVALVIIWPATWCAANMLGPRLWVAASAAATVLGVIFTPLRDMTMHGFQAMRAARADSTRVRDALERIAIDRWHNEAPVFGHGIVERGPHLVEYMPIGSHHSWYGLLFVKGVVGALALAVPMVASLLECLVKAQIYPVARVALGMMLMMFIYSFGENLEILIYLFWPAMIILGSALRAGKH